MQQLLTIIVFGTGVAFIAAGGIGEFSANSLIGPHGLVQTNALHDYLHVASGLLLCLGVLRKMLTALWLASVGYLIIAVLGYLSNDSMLLGHIQVNAFDHHLHMAAAVFLGLLTMLVTRTRRHAWSVSPVFVQQEMTK